jgi:NTE family protein
MWNIFRKAPPKIGLTLGSGGAKGMAHLGALKAFAEEGITFDVVTGTSIGSIVGAAYAMGMSWEESLQAVKTVNFSSLKKKGLLASITMTDSEAIERALLPILGERDISSLNKPFAAVAVDLLTGEEAVFTQGNLVKALTASSAMVPAFSPLVWEGKHLVDGAYLNPIPADVARALGAEVVVSIDLSTPKSAATDSLQMVGVMLSTIKIAMKNARYKGYQNSDIVIHPDLTGYAASKFEGLDEMFAIGYEETKKRMPEIKSLLKRHRVKFGGKHG